MVRPVKVVALLLSVALGALLSACGLFLSFSDYDTGEGPRLAVKGTVDGLEGVKVKLLVNGIEPGLELGNGPFEFPASVADHTTYTVTVPADPAGHACKIENASGPVSGADVTNVLVHCLATDASLASLIVTGAGPLSPTFASDHFAYTAGTVRTPFLGVGAPPTAIFTATPKSSGARVTVASTSTSGAPIAIHAGTNAIPITVTAAAPGIAPQTTTVTIDGKVEDYLKASNPQTNAGFGGAVALSGTTLAIGAPSESTGAIGVNGIPMGKLIASSGAVYVFTTDGTTWTQDAFIKASNTSAAAQFGGAVALSGDTLVVGSAFETGISKGINGDQTTTGSNQSGAVYVFRRTGTTWSQEAYIKASDAAGDAGFGESVAIAGDTLVVGAPRAVTGNGKTGQVYAFTRTGTTWSGELMLADATVSVSGFFGASVALSTDTIAVGSPGSFGSVTNPGAAYVFVRGGAVWLKQAVVGASTPHPGVQFGYSVALSGDTLAVGAVSESSAATGVGGSEADQSASRAGAAYVFTRAGTLWSQQAYVKASNTRKDAQFGVSVALAGDLLAVGAPYESSGATLLDGNESDISAPTSGAVYLYARTGITWAKRSYVKARVARGDANFGGAIAFDGKNLAVGAAGERSASTGINGDPNDTSLIRAGAAWVFF